MPTYKQDMKATSGNMGGGRKKRKKDDNENKGRRSGKGPKPMKVKTKVKKESAKQERKNLLTENPVVNRSKEPVVKRFQGSTKKLGNTKAMKGMLSGALEKGLAADLGEKLIKMTPMPVPKLPTPRIKQPLTKKITPVPQEATKLYLLNKIKEKGSEAKVKFKPSKRDMELKEAHLGKLVQEEVTPMPVPKLPAQKSANPAKLTYTKAGGPVKPKDKKAKR